MEKFMTSVIKIGNLSLDMGNMSHAIGVIKNNLETYLNILHIKHHLMVLNDE